MYTKIQVVFDAAEPAKLAEFWAMALGYVEQPPPEGFGSWEEFGRSIGLPEERFGDQAALIDPAGEGPRIFIQRVPEPKIAKNRVHLDIRVAPREASRAERDRMMEERAAELVAAGASIAWRVDNEIGKAIVLRDPEGNEFCLD